MINPRGYYQLPLDPAMALWLDAADASTVSVATGVSVWRDKSGNGLDAVQATTSAQPAYQLNVLNGLPALYFDGVDDLLAIPDNALLEFPTGGYTMFFVYRYTTGGLIAKFSKGNQNSTDVGYSQTSTSMRGRTDSAAGYTSGTGFSANTNIIGTFVQKSNGTDQQYYNQNGLITSTTAAGGTTGGSSSFRIARGATGNYAEMYAHEFCFYKREFTSDEITKMRLYLSSKWGISIV